jgi:hypothetical protein
VVDQRTPRPQLVVERHLVDSLFEGVVGVAGEGVALEQQEVLGVRPDGVVDLAVAGVEGVDERTGGCVQQLELGAVVELKLSRGLENAALDADCLHPSVVGSHDQLEDVALPRPNALNAAETAVVALGMLELAVDAVRVHVLLDLHRGTATLRKRRSWLAQTEPIAIIMNKIIHWYCSDSSR